MKDADIQENLLSLSEISKTLKQTLEMLKVETIETLERLKKESEMFAKKIADAGQHDIPWLIQLILLSSRLSEP